MGGWAVKTPEQIAFCGWCSRKIEPERAEWADTCWLCSGMGCPATPDDALAGRPCDSCDCVRPRNPEGAR